MFYQLEHIGYTGHFIRETGENFSYPAHMHRCFEFITVLEGTMTVTVGKRNYRLERNRSVLIFPDQIHSLASTDCRHLLFIFSADLIAAFAAAHKGERPTNAAFTLSEGLARAITGLSAEADKLYKKGLLYLLCSEFDRQCVYQKSDPVSLGSAEKVLRYIADHFAEDCSLETVAAAVGYDPSYISRQFKTAVGIAYNQYLRIYRLDHACHLLQNTDRGILSCAMESGFSSVRSFNRNFVDVFGLSPHEYRRQSEKQNST